MMFTAGLSILAIALSFAGVGVFRRWAEKRGILDLPNDRSSHTQPTPRGGGLVIVVVALALGSVLSATTGALVRQFWSTRVTDDDITSFAFLPVLAASLWVFVRVQERRGASAVRIESEIREGH
jgi:UDP-N-acetylmuramyl pentapeptide phosphotransferase/UDP-N-acetylglucosamine-1-phosphate transferase